MGYSLVVFDWDGTLMDSTHSIVAAIQGACRDLDLPVPSASSASWVIGLSLESALRRAVPELTQAMVPRFLERYRTHYLLRDSELRLFEGVRELLADLASQDVRLAVATGKSRVGLNRALAATGLGPLFDATRTADETFSKPHPAMLQELMHELGHEADAVVMVGIPRTTCRWRPTPACTAWVSPMAPIPWRSWRPVPRRRWSTAWPCCANGCWRARRAASRACRRSGCGNGRRGALSYLDRRHARAAVARRRNSAAHATVYLGKSGRHARLHRRSPC